MHFTDSHCHLDFPEFAEQLTPLLNECHRLAIRRIIIPAVSPSNWQRIFELSQSVTAAKSNVALLPCLGLHPWYLAGLTFKDLDNLADMAHQYKQQLCAIGETGIDGTIALQQDNLAKQKVFFHQQILLANALAKPLIVHHRRSHNEIAAMLKATPVSSGGIIHAFSGSYQQGKSYIDMGFKLGIGGTISYERAKKTINAVKRFPLDALVLETDAPAMPLSGQQGQANSPVNLIKVFELLCAIRSESPTELAQALEDNIDTLFSR